MNSNIESLTMEKLKDFARDNALNQITVKGKYDNIYLLVKIKYSQHITLIYKSNSLSDDNDYNISNIKFEKIGFYNSQDDNLYNLAFYMYWDFYISEKEVEDTPTISKVYDSVIKAIEDKARSIIDETFKTEKLSKEKLVEQRYKNFVHKRLQRMRRGIRDKLPV